jgi:hypothetical protein
VHSLDFRDKLRSIPPPQTHGPLSPVELQVAAIAAEIRRTEEVTVAWLLNVLGGSSYGLVLLVLSVLNMIPGPPGYGGTVAFVMMAVTLAMLFGRPLRLGGWLGARKLSNKVLDRLLGQMHWFAGLVARLTRPRLEFLTGPATERAIGILILIVSLPMVLPIPFINAVPNTGIAIICVSRLNRDGLGVLIGIIIALLGLAIAISAIFAVAMLVSSLVAR